MKIRPVGVELCHADIRMDWREVLISNFHRVLNVVFILLGDSPASEFYVPTFRNTPFHLYNSCVQDDLRRWNGQSVPKLRHIKFSRRGITKKKEHNKQIVAFCNCTNEPKNCSTYVILYKWATTTHVASEFFKGPSGRRFRNPQNQS
jgi:hypothetical protein